MIRSVVLALLVSSSAYADPGNDRSHVAATAGLATPTGEVGVEYTLVTPHHLEIGFGVGLATLLSPPSVQPDPQLAIMPRYREHAGPGVFTLGAGLSGGRYTVLGSPFSDYAVLQQSYALWANAEVGYEVVSRAGVFARVYAGGGKIIAHRMIDTTDSSRMLLDSALPYAGVPHGYAF